MPAFIHFSMSLINILLSFGMTVLCWFGVCWVLPSFLFLWMFPLKWSRWLAQWTRFSLTCVSVSMSEVATSKRLGLDRYLLSLNWFSSSSSCWLVKAVRGLRHFPNRPDWGPAGGGTEEWSVFGFMVWQLISYLTLANKSLWIHLVFRGVFILNT